MINRCLCFGLIAVVTALILSTPSLGVLDTLPTQIPDAAFWKMTSEFSEEGGFFNFEVMSNEREFPSVISRLKKSTIPGGVYLGVGPEQNFTYIAAIRPKIAFIFDIRRQNMLEHLIYKAVFEASSNRADFVSRLFSRKRPAGLDERSRVDALFEAFSDAVPDPQLFRENLQAINDRLMNNHRFQLSSHDQADIHTIYRALFDAGPVVNSSIGNFGGFGGVGYGDLMAVTDEQGLPRSYLATEDNFQFVREMERKNLIIPLVGNFAGSKAIRAVAEYLKAHQATVTGFYASNVEQYLFQQSDGWQRFYMNVSLLPIDSSSTFIRSAHFAYGNGAQPRFPRTTYFMLLCPMSDLITAFKGGRIQSYDQVIRMSR